jgi:hypothetical protein
MKQSVPGQQPSTQSQIALHLMINQLSVSAIPGTISQHHMIVNEIPEKLYVNADMHELAAVIGSLMNTMISHVCNNPIYVSAKNYGNVMLLHLRSNDRLNNPAFTNSLAKMNQLAENLGGTVAITSSRNEVTTVALSFINGRLAA